MENVKSLKVGDRVKILVPFDFKNTNYNKGDFFSGVVTLVENYFYEIELDTPLLVSSFSRRGYPKEKESINRVKFTIKDNIFLSVYR